ncbi:MAG: DUF642 domain-containing protein [Amphritea sp.]|nr:DUF642 domain-containing protein [Amphritea sp.]
MANYIFFSGVNGEFLRLDLDQAASSAPVNYYNTADTPSGYSVSHSYSQLISELRKQFIHPRKGAHLVAVDLKVDAAGALHATIVFDEKSKVPHRTVETIKLPHFASRFPGVAASRADVKPPQHSASFLAQMTSISSSRDTKNVFIDKRRKIVSSAVDGRKVVLGAFKKHYAVIIPGTPLQRIESLSSLRDVKIVYSEGGTTVVWALTQSGKIQPAVFGRAGGLDNAASSDMAAFLNNAQERYVGIAVGDNGTAYAIDKSGYLHVYRSDKGIASFERSALPMLPASVIKSLGGLGGTHSRFRLKLSVDKTTGKLNVVNNYGSVVHSTLVSDYLDSDYKNLRFGLVDTRAGGDYVLRDGVLYKANTPGVWRKDMSAALQGYTEGSLKKMRYNHSDDSISIIAQGDSVLHKTGAGSFVAHDFNIPSGQIVEAFSHRGVVYALGSDGKLYFDKKNGINGSFDLKLGGIKSFTIDTTSGREKLVALTLGGDFYTFNLPSGSGLQAAVGLTKMSAWQQAGYSHERVLTDAKGRLVFMQQSDNGDDVRYARFDSASQMFKTIAQAGLDAKAIISVREPGEYVVETQEGRRYSLSQGAVYYYDHSLSKWVGSGLDQIKQLRLGADGKVYALSHANDEGRLSSQVIQLNDAGLPATSGVISLRADGSAVERGRSLQLAGHVFDFTIKADGSLVYLDGDNKLRRLSDFQGHAENRLVGSISTVQLASVSAADKALLAAKPLFSGDAPKQVVKVNGVGWLLTTSGKVYLTKTPDDFSTADWVPLEKTETDFRVDSLVGTAFDRVGLKLADGSLYVADNEGQYRRVVDKPSALAVNGLPANVRIKNVVANNAGQLWALTSDNRVFTRSTQSGDWSDVGLAGLGQAKPAGIEVLSGGGFLLTASDGRAYTFSDQNGFERYNRVVSRPAFDVHVDSLKQIENQQAYLRRKAQVLLEKKGRADLVNQYRMARLNLPVQLYSRANVFSRTVARYRAHLGINKGGGIGETSLVTNAKRELYRAWGDLKNPAYAGLRKSAITAGTQRHTFVNKQQALLDTASNKALQKILTGLDLLDASGNIRSANDWKKTRQYKRYHDALPYTRRNNRVFRSPDSNLIKRLYDARSQMFGTSDGMALKLKAMLDAKVYIPVVFNHAKPLLGSIGLPAASLVVNQSLLSSVVEKGNRLEMYLDEKFPDDPLTSAAVEKAHIERFDAALSQKIKDSEVRGFVDSNFSNFDHVNKVTHAARNLAQRFKNKNGKFQRLLTRKGLGNTDIVSEYTRVIESMKVGESISLDAGWKVDARVSANTLAVLKNMYKWLYINPVLSLGAGFGRNDSVTFSKTANGVDITFGRSSTYDQSFAIGANVGWASSYGSAGLKGAAQIGSFFSAGGSALLSVANERINGSSATISIKQTGDGGLQEALGQVLSGDFDAADYIRQTGKAAALRNSKVTVKVGAGADATAQLDVPTFKFDSQGRKYQHAHTVSLAAFFAGAGWGRKRTQAYSASSDGVDVNQRTTRSAVQFDGTVGLLYVGHKERVQPWPAIGSDNSDHGIIRSDANSNPYALPNYDNPRNPIMNKPRSGSWVKKFHNHGKMPDFKLHYDKSFTVRNVSWDIIASENAPLSSQLPFDLDDQPAEVRKHLVNMTSLTTSQRRQDILTELNRLSAHYRQSGNTALAAALDSLKKYTNFIDKSDRKNFRSELGKIRKQFNLTSEVNLLKSYTNKARIGGDRASWVEQRANVKFSLELNAQGIKKLLAYDAGADGDFGDFTKKLAKNKAYTRIASISSSLPSQGLETKQGLSLIPFVHVGSSASLSYSRPNSVIQFSYSDAHFISTTETRVADLSRSMVDNASDAAAMARLKREKAGLITDLLGSLGLDRNNLPQGSNQKLLFDKLNAIGTLGASDRQAEIANTREVKRLLSLVATSQGIRKHKGVSYSYKGDLIRQANGYFEAAANDVRLLNEKARLGIVAPFSNYYEPPSDNVSVNQSLLSSRRILLQTLNITSYASDDKINTLRRDLERIFIKYKEKAVSDTLQAVTQEIDRRKQAAPSDYTDARYKAEYESLKTSRLAALKTQVDRVVNTARTGFNDFFKVNINTGATGTYVERDALLTSGTVFAGEPAFKLAFLELANAHIKSVGKLVGSSNWQKLNIDSAKVVSVRDGILMYRDPADPTRLIPLPQDIARRVIGAEGGRILHAMHARVNDDILLYRSQIGGDYTPDSGAHAGQPEQERLQRLLDEHRESGDTKQPDNQPDRYTGNLFESMNLETILYGLNRDFSLMERLSPAQLFLLKEFFPDSTGNGVKESEVQSLVRSPEQIKGFMTQVRMLAELPSQPGSSQLSARINVERLIRWQGAGQDMAAGLSRIAGRLRGLPGRVSTNFSPQSFYVGALGKSIGNHVKGQCGNLSLAYLFSLSQGGDGRTKFLKALYLQAGILQRAADSEAPLSKQEVKDSKNFRKAINSLSSSGYQASVQDSVLQGEGKLTLDAVIDRLSQSSGDTSYQLNSGNHALVIGLRRQGNQNRYYFYDPNAGDVEIPHTDKAAGAKALKTLISRHFSQTNSKGHWQGTLADYYDAQRNKAGQLVFEAYRFNSAKAQSNAAFKALKTQIHANGFISEIDRLKAKDGADGLLTIEGVTISREELYRFGATVDGKAIDANVDLTDADVVKRIKYSAVSILDLTRKGITDQAAKQVRLLRLQMAQAARPDDLLSTPDGSADAINASKALNLIKQHVAYDSATKKAQIGADLWRNFQVERDAAGKNRRLNRINRISSRIGRTLQGYSYYQGLLALSNLKRRSEMTAAQKAEQDLDLGLMLGGFAADLSENTIEKGLSNMGSRLNLAGKRLANRGFYNISGKPGTLGSSGARLARLMKHTRSGIGRAAAKLGSSLAKAAGPIVGVALAGLDIYDAFRSFAKADKLSGKARQDALVSGGLAVTSAVVGIATSIGVAVAMAVGAAAAVSALGVVGVAIGALIALGGAIYSAVRQVEEYDKYLDLNGWQKFKLGIRLFFGDGLSSDERAQILKAKRINATTKAYRKILNEKAGKVLEGIKDDSAGKNQAFYVSESAVVNSSSRNFQSYKVLYYEWEEYLSSPKVGTVRWRLKDPVILGAGYHESERYAALTAGRSRKPNASIGYQFAKPYIVFAKDVMLPEIELVEHNDTLDLSGAGSATGRVRVKATDNPGQLSGFRVPQNLDKVTISLGGGDDRFTGNNAYKHTVVIGDGRKHYVGGNKNDAFIIAKSYTSGSFFDGGGGTDSLILSGARKDVVNLKTNSIHFRLSRYGRPLQTARIQGFENVFGRVDRDDEITGDDQKNLINGRGGSDVIRGEGGDDILIGYGNALELHGGEGSDVFFIKKAPAPTQDQQISIFETESNTDKNTVYLDFAASEVLNVRRTTTSVHLELRTGNYKTVVTLNGVYQRQANGDYVRSRRAFTIVSKDGFTLIPRWQKVIKADSRLPGGYEAFEKGFYARYDLFGDKTVSAVGANVNSIRVGYHANVRTVAVHQPGKNTYRRLPGFMELLTEGGNSADFVWGADGTDLLRGYQGVDWLRGREGQDTYVVHLDHAEINNSSLSTDKFKKTDVGTKYIENNSSDKKQDYLLYNAKRTDIGYRVNGRDLEIYFKPAESRAPKVVLKSFMYSETYRHISLVDSEGVTYTIGVDSNNKAYISEDGFVAGTSRDDLLSAVGAPITLLGGNGDDLLLGRSAAGQEGDKLFGGKGDDILVGASGDDTLTGGDGDDLLYDQSGDAILAGGNGSDHLIFEAASTGVKLIDANQKDGTQDTVWLPFALSSAHFARKGNSLVIQGQAPDAPKGTLLTILLKNYYVSAARQAVNIMSYDPAALFDQDMRAELLRLPADARINAALRILTSLGQAKQRLDGASVKQKKPLIKAYLQYYKNALVALGQVQQAHSGVPERLSKQGLLEIARRAFFTTALREDKPPAAVPLQGTDQDDTVVLENNAVADANGVHFQGGKGDDHVQGNSHDNTLKGGDDEDTLYGYAGNDTLYGDSGSDRLHGGKGDDIIYSGGAQVFVDPLSPSPKLNSWVDYIDGGSGRDTFAIDNSGLKFAPGHWWKPKTTYFIRGRIVHGKIIEAHLTGHSFKIDLNAGTADYIYNRLYKRYFGGWSNYSDTLSLRIAKLSNIENVIGSDLNDIIIGNRHANVIDGGRGADRINAGGGDDTVKITANVFRSSTPALLASEVDTVDGGSGNDTIRLSSAALRYRPGPWWTPKTTYYSAPSVIGSIVEAHLTGHSFTVDLSAGTVKYNYSRFFKRYWPAYANHSSNEQLTVANIRNFENAIGTDINDTLVGNEGANLLAGGNGNDTLNGGGGLDTASYQYGTFTHGVEVRLDGGASYQRRADGSRGGRDDTLVSIENVIGSEQNDKIVGDGVANRLDGAGGRDYLNGGHGADQLYGGADNDSLLGGSGADRLFGGSGDDSLTGGLGVDTLNGGSGRDTATYNGLVHSGGVKVDLAAGAAYDRRNNSLADRLISIENVKGTSRNDILIGSSGDNDLYGSGGDDQLNGGAGNDRLWGGDDADVLRGGDGNDVLDGGAGDDLLEGGAGDDILHASAGSDQYNGGAGSDTLSFENASSAVKASLGARTGSELIINGSFETLTTSDPNLQGYFERSAQITLSSPARMHGWSYVGKMKIFNNGGGIGIKASNGRSMVQLDSAADTLNEISTRVALVSGKTYRLSFDMRSRSGQPEGVEVYLGQTLIKSVSTQGGLWSAHTIDLVAPSTGQFSLRFKELSAENDGSGTLLDNVSLVEKLTQNKITGIENLLGSRWNDQLSGNADANRIDGGLGNDRLYGKAGNDKLIGGRGDDWLYGGEGSDVLDGGVGNDLLFGGEGDDTFVISYGSKVVSGGSGSDTVSFKEAPNALTARLATGQFSMSAKNLINNSSFEQLTAAPYVRKRKVSVLANSWTSTKSPEIKIWKQGTGSVSASDGKNMVHLDPNDDLVQTVSVVAGEKYSFSFQSRAFGRVAQEVKLYFDGQQVARFSSVAGLWDRQSAFIVPARTGDFKLMIKAGPALYGSTGVLLDEVRFERASPTLRVTSIENVTGTQFNDSIWGDAVANRLDGKEGDDVLKGLAGDDVLLGGSGNDTLNGGAGADTLRGGIGDDTYVLHRGHGKDVLADTGGRDIIRYNGTAVPAEQIGFDRLWFKRNSANKHLYISLNEGGGSTSEVTVQNYFSSAANKVEEIQIGSKKLTSANIDLLVNMMAGLTAFDYSATAVGSNKTVIQEINNRLVDINR